MNSERGSRDFLELEDKKTTKIRIYPGHPDTPDDWYVMRKKHWLPFRNDDGDLSRRPFWNAVLHGGQKEDIVDVYIEFVKQNGSDDDIKKTTDWKTGIKAKNDWALYGQMVEKKKDENTGKVKETLTDFGILEFGTLVRDQLLEQAVMEDDDEIEVDPYTHPVDGLPVLIKRDKSAAKNANKYRLSVATRSVKILPELLEEFLKKDSLVKMYRECYKLDDFEKAIECLQLFDEEYEIDLFENEEFQEKIEELRELLAEGAEAEEEYTDDDDSEEEDEDNDTEEEAEEEDEEEEDEEGEGYEDDEFDEMTRKELLAYIKENELPIKRQKSKSDDQYRDEIRQHINEEDAGEEDEDEDDLAALKSKLKKGRK